MPPIAVLAFGLIMLGAAPAFAADPVEGEWLTQGGSGKVRIIPCAGRPDRMCGVISWLKDPANATAKDTHNPDPALRSRLILGMPMLWGFHQVAPGKWTGGRIYDPNTGKTYDSKIAVNAKGALKVDGCVVMICQAQTWTR
jgi:uncharacterized protein (DUF2147 family)